MLVERRNGGNVGGASRNGTGPSVRYHVSDHIVGFLSRLSFFDFH